MHFMLGDDLTLRPREWSILQYLLLQFPNGHLFKAFYKRISLCLLNEKYVNWRTWRTLYPPLKLLTLYICCFIKNMSLAQVFSCEFCEICKNFLLAEHHRTTASYYSSINGNEGRIGKRNCKLWYKIKAYVPIWARGASYQKRTALVKFEQVSEAVVRRFSSK